MERVAETKVLPRTLPVLVEVSDAHKAVIREAGQRLTGEDVSCARAVSARELNQFSKARDDPMTLLASSREVAQLSNARILLVREDTGFNTRSSQKPVSAAPTRTPKGKASFPDHKELLPDIEMLKSSSDSFGETDPSSFAGASHPPEPIDTDLMRTVYVPIGQNKSEAGCLMKSMSLKGPNLEDLSIHNLTKKPILAVVSPAESTAEESNDMRNSALPFSGAHALQNTKISLPPPGSEENDCVWDSSLPPSGNVSPHSSVDSTSVVRTMSIANSCASTYRSDAFTSDGMLSIDKNCDSIKGTVRGDSLESAKTSASRASDSSGLSDDSNWSNITGSASKPHKGNDPRWKAILAVRARDGNLGMSHFKLLRRLGCGDIGSVYLSELSATRCYFAMKVMDKASLSARKKLIRAQTEREILQLLDHPFLPMLYTHFETDRFSCLVMEYCPGGDLHALRQRQPGKHFSEYAARYVRLYKYTKLFVNCFECFPSQKLFFVNHVFIFHTFSILKICQSLKENKPKREV